MDDSEIELLAVEMKANAEANPVKREQMLRLDFPQDLKRKITIDDTEYHVQYSIDELGPDKEMVHLSCSQRSMVIPDENIQHILRKAFFSGERPRAITDVVVFPGMLGSHVLHMGYIRHKS